MPEDETPVPANLVDLVEERLNKTMLLRGKKLPSEMRYLVTATYEGKEKRTMVGLLHQHGNIVQVAYNSPFRGSLLVGDMILTVNNSPVSFDEVAPTEPQTSGGAKFVKKKEKEKEKIVVKKPPGDRKDFKTTVASLLAGGEKITIHVARLKTREKCLKIPTLIPQTPEYLYEIATIFQFKYLKLGLNMMQTNGRVIVNYTMPDTISNICLNIGETILAVDEKPVSTLEEVRQRILDGCNVNGFARLLLEFPTTDQLRNMVRAQLAFAGKDSDRPTYLTHTDVRKFSEEGIETLKKAKDPTPIIKEVDAKKKKSKKEVINANKDSNIVFNQKTEEFAVPSEWNSKLFVELPSLKTKESETKK